MMEGIRKSASKAEVEELLLRSAEGMTVLHEISSVFLSSLDLKKALETALGLMAEYHGADFMFVGSPDDEYRRVEVLASAGLDGRVSDGGGCELDIDFMPAYSVLEKRSAIVIDFSEDGALKMPEIFLEQGVRSGISVPMVAGDRAVGVLCMLYMKPMPFQTAELWHLNVVANLLSVYIQKESTLERLRDSEAFLSSVLEGIGDGVVVVDPDFRILSANKGYLSLKGLSIEEVAGVHCYEYTHNSSKPCHEEGEICTVKGVFDTGEHHSALHTHYDREGKTVYVQTNAYPIRDGSGRVVAAVETISDVTEKVRLEKDLEKRVRELEEFYDMAVGRELRMVELKDEIARLREELARYRSP